MASADSFPSKRGKYAHPSPTPLAATISRALSTEPALLRTILRFVPRGDQDASPASDALQTIVRLCRAVPGLSKAIGPDNVGLWRAMVLDHFDFTVDRETTFNVADDADYISVCREKMTYGDDDDDDDDACKDTWDTHPVKPFVDGWEALHPRHREPQQYLQHALAFWPKLGTFFRPHEYGFLGDVQHDRTLLTSHAWPAHEDAFALFWDLTMVEQLARPSETYRTWSDGDQFVSPCLLGTFDREITHPGYELLAFCDLYPHFWYGNPPVTDTWTGFGGAPPRVDGDGGDHQQWQSGALGVTAEERDVFPMCATRRSFLELRRLVYDRCSDWRRVHVNVGEYPSPEFYLGKSTTSQRWMGLVGRSDYAAGGRHDE